MKEKLFTIKIWKWNKLLHQANYQFKTSDNAQNYALGLFNGMNLMNAGATGIETKPVKK